MATLIAIPTNRKHYRLNRSIRPTTIIFGCIDPWRVNQLFRFAHEDLRLEDGEFIPILNPGGIMYLCGSGFAKEYIHLFDTARFCFKKFPSISAVVAVNHDDCGGYQNAVERHGQKFLHGMSVGDLQMKHLTSEWKDHIRLAADMRPPNTEEMRFRAFHMRTSEEDPEEAFFKEVEIG